jgi:myo-inositol-1(or 4)-monophosphatase
MHALLNIAVRAARRGANVLLRGVDRISDLEIQRKGPRDFVSEIDRNAEREIIDVIQRSYPSHGILAEESGAQPGDDFTWVIDPLDGTTNYIRGIPHFCISIAVMQGNRVEHGVVYDPLREELFVASRGAGAMLNNRRVRVSRCDRLSEAVIGCGYFPGESGLLPGFAAICETLDGESILRRSGSAALDLAYVAAGRYDGFFELELRRWDMAAGALIAREAGAMVAAPDGSESYLDQGRIVAGTPRVFKALLTHVHRGIKRSPAGPEPIQEPSPGTQADA